MFKPFATVLTLVGLAVAATPAWAAQDNSGSNGGKELPPFKKADKDGSGKMSLKEAKKLGIQKETFQKEDLDNDGKLTKYDYKYGVKLK